MSLLAYKVAYPSRGQCSRCLKAKKRGNKALKLTYFWLATNRPVCGKCGYELTVLHALDKVVNG